MKRKNILHVGYKVITCALFTFFITIAHPVFAQLLITPFHVVMSERTRSAQIVLVNSGNTPNTYRILWDQLKQNENGNYIKLTDEQRKESYDLEDFAIFSPRQITLQPKEKQTIRIALRRPAELPDGEYKSHIKFEIIPELSPRPQDNTETEEGKIRFGASVYASYSIPVIYRTTPHDVMIEIQEPSFGIVEKTGNIMIKLPVKRSGPHGVVGYTDVYYQPTEGKEVLIGSLGNTSIYPELSIRTFNVPTNIKSLSSGKIRVVFYKAEDDAAEKEPLDERTFNIGN